MPAAFSLRSHGTEMHVPGEAEIRAALVERNPQAPSKSIKQMAKLVAVFADVLADLAFEDRNRIPVTKSGLREAILKVLPGSARTGEIGRRSFDAPDRVERKIGSGLGELLTLEEGCARLTRYAEARPLESWAGPVAGPGEIERELGVPRSTLNEWRRRGAVIGLLRGERKHVYPLDQFVDARPTPGVGDVARIAPDGRAAWLWLRQPHGRFDMTTPLEALRAGLCYAVLEAAKRDFV